VNAVQITSFYIDPPPHTHTHTHTHTRALPRFLLTNTKRSTTPRLIRNFDFKPSRPPTGERLQSAEIPTGKCTPAIQEKKSTTLSYWPWTPHEQRATEVLRIELVWTESWSYKVQRWFRIPPRHRGLRPTRDDAAGARRTNSLPCATWKPLTSKPLTSKSHLPSFHPPAGNETTPGPNLPPRTETPPPPGLTRSWTLSAYSKVGGGGATDRWTGPEPRAPCSEPVLAVLAPHGHKTSKHQGPPEISQLLSNSHSDIQETLRLAAPIPNTARRPLPVASMRLGSKETAATWTRYWLLSTAFITHNPSGQVRSEKQEREKVHNYFLDFRNNYIHLHPKIS